MGFILGQRRRRCFIIKPDLSQCLVVREGGGGLLLLAALETLTGGFNQDPDVICLSNEMCIYDLHISQHQKCIIQPETLIV